MVAISGNVKAQQVLTLQDFLSKVEKNNPEILAGKKQVASKEAMRKAAGGWEDPMGMFGLERMPTTYPAPGSSNIFVEDELYAKNIGISQKLPIFGTLRQRKKIAGQEKIEAEFALRATRLERLAEAKKAYYEWARLQKDRHLLERAYLVWERLVGQTQTAYAKAQGEHHAYLRAQVELVKVEAEKLENAEALKRIAARLNFLAGEALAAENLAAEPLRQEAEGGLILDSAVRLAEQYNPEIKMFSAAEERVRFEKSLTAKGYFPDLELSLYRDQQIDHFMPSQLMNVYGGRVSFRLPFFFWTTRSKEVQGKSLEAERALALRKNMENQIRAEVEMFWAEIERLEKLVRLYKEELLPRAQLLVEEGQTAYTVGRLSFPDFSEAQLEQIDLERKYYGFLADFWKAKAELEKTVGLE
ncbi:MAG TPA: TolC family protein [candidate division Zixibacteria bacterium]|nr:TolC family protein [candidate division Zixibacteria bacterium]